MGLAILPGRLKEELELSLQYIQNGKEDQSLEQHKPWLDELKKKMTIQTVNDLYIEVGKVFTRVLEDSGVFKLNDKGMNAIDSFILEVLHQK